MNDAFLSKLGWGVLTQPSDLLVKVLKGKYAHGKDLRKETCFTN